MIVNYYPGGTVNRLGAPIKYTGSFFVKIDESNPSNWECHLLTSGNLSVTKDVNVDIFLVGGGGGGGSSVSGSSVRQWSSGGGGGRTWTETNVLLTRSTLYTAVIGNGGTRGSASGSDGGDGGTTSLIDNTNTLNLSAAGGQGGNSVRASGGRAGGRGGQRWSNAGDTVRTSGAYGGSPTVLEGAYPDSYNLDEKVSAFWEDGATPYAGGGAGGGYLPASGFSAVAETPGVDGPCGNYGGEGGGGDSCHDGMPNTGGGGGGGYTLNTRAGNGGSGIIIIRNHRTSS